MAVSRRRRCGWVIPIAVFLVILMLLGLCWILSAQPFTSLTDKLGEPSMTENESGSFTLLTANVGNADPRCLPYVVKLCRKDVEARVAQNIQALRPDVIALQETMPIYMCEKYPIAVPGSICGEPTEIPQIRRLVGADYTIVCESRNGFECIAVHVDAGEILGCDPGSLCETDRLDYQLEGCRWNVAIMAATVRVRGHTFDFVNAHPESRSAACRLASIRQIFEDRGQPDSLVRQEHALLVGDFNLDPWREDDVSGRYWNTQVGMPGGSFYYHSGPAEREPPYPTLRYSFFERTYDHVVSNFLEGTTQVLGKSSGTMRLDGGKGMDHRAVYGRLSFKSGENSSEVP